MNTYKKYMSYLSRMFYGKEDSLALYEKENDTETIVEINNETVHGLKAYDPINRPWGHYTPIFEDGAYFNKVTRIVVFVNNKLSLQSHNKRSKHWIIIKGHAKIQIGNTDYNVGTSIHVYIPINTDHRIENIGVDVLEFIEIQIGEVATIRYKND